MEHLKRRTHQQYQDNGTNSAVLSAPASVAILKVAGEEEQGDESSETASANSAVLSAPASIAILKVTGEEEQGDEGSETACANSAVLSAPALMATTNS